MSHNCSSHVQKVETGAAKTHPIEWNSVPLAVVCAFPYILAFSTDAIEFRCDLAAFKKGRMHKRPQVKKVGKSH